MISTDPTTWWLFLISCRNDFLIYSTPTVQLSTDFSYWSVNQPQIIKTHKNYFTNSTSWLSNTKRWHQLQETINWVSILSEKDIIFLVCSKNCVSFKESITSIFLMIMSGIKYWKNMWIQMELSVRVNMPVHWKIAKLWNNFLIKLQWPPILGQNWLLNLSWKCYHKVYQQRRKRLFSCSHLSQRKDNKLRRLRNKWQLKIDCRRRMRKK